MLAAMNGHTTTVKLLLDFGSDINAQVLYMYLYSVVTYMYMYMYVIFHLLSFSFCLDWDQS